MPDMTPENYTKIRMKGEGTPKQDASTAPIKRKGWGIPGMGFIDFKQPVTFEEAKACMEEMTAKMKEKQK